MELISKILLQVFVVGIAMLIAYLDYIWHDRRTKKFKLARRYLFLATLLFLGASIYSLIIDESNKVKEKVNREEEIKELKKYYENQIDLLTQINNASLNTIDKTDSIITRTDLLNKNLINNFNLLKTTTNELLYSPVTDFFLDITLFFKDTTLTKIIQNEDQGVNNYKRLITNSTSKTVYGRHFFLNNNDLCCIEKEISEYILTNFSWAYFSLDFNDKTNFAAFSASSSLLLLGPFDRSFNANPENKITYNLVYWNDGSYQLGIVNIPVNSTNYNGIKNLHNLKKYNLEFSYILGHQSKIKDHHYISNNIKIDKFSVSLSTTKHDILKGREPIFVDKSENNTETFKFKKVDYLFRVKH